MKKQLLTIGAVALATLATQQAAHATLTTVSDGTATFNSAASGTISVGFDVVYDSTSSLYTYLYEFTPLANSPIGQFTVNAQYVSSVLTTADSFSGSPYTLTGSITSGGTLPYTGIVSWNYNPYTTAEQLVGFTSVDGPGNGSGSLNDGQSGPWGDNATGTPIPVPVPIPEASTVLAGALMLLPFGIGAIRSLRKERAV